MPESTITLNQLSSNKNSTSSIFKKLNSVLGYGKNFQPWSGWELNLFRFIFLFFIILAVPLDWKFYRDVLSIPWTNLHFHDLFELTKYQVQFISQEKLPLWGIASFTNWGIAALLALVGSLVWKTIDSKRKEYNVLYHWLRVIVRYRLAIALLTYGFIKFFPLQMPYSSLSNLMTNYGDYYAWKIYFQTLGIAPKYESFLGFVELLAAFLIFNRKTVTFGVGLVFGFLGNVAVTNVFYDIGEHVYSTYLVLLAAFLFAHDIPKLWNLLVNEKGTSPGKLIPDYSDNTIRKIRWTLKCMFLAFTMIFGFKTYANFASDPYKVPRTPGLYKSYGLYNVRTFIINKDTIPYSKTDKRRWQDVVFEKWSTLTINQNRPVIIDKESEEVAPEKDIDRRYEIAGFAGRHYFYYEADTVLHTLNLRNKNKNHKSETMFLKYDRPDDSTIVLKGINENKELIEVVLEKNKEKFMMYEGRRKQVKI